MQHVSCCWLGWMLSMCREATAAGCRRGCDCIQISLLAVLGRRITSWLDSTASAELQPSALLMAITADANHDIGLCLLCC
jgi:hypothetical protein